MKSESLSKTEKKVLIALIVVVISVAIMILGFFISMYIGYNSKEEWCGLLEQEKTWKANNSEIVFSLTDYNYYLGPVYNGQINGRKVDVHLSSVDENNKTISFYDSGTNTLIAKADVTNYSAEKFDAIITKDKLGLSKKKYTFVTV